MVGTTYPDGVPGGHNKGGGSLEAGHSANDSQNSLHLVGRVREEEVEDCGIAFITGNTEHFSQVP